MGYSRHPNALVESDLIGKNTEISAFTHILNGARIGSDCKIGDYVYIESDVKIGDRVIIKSGVQLCDGLRIEDDVFIGPGVTFACDFSLADKFNSGEPAQTVIQKEVHIGANATIFNGVVIGRNAKICACAVVTKNIPSNAIITGNPARITGYVSTQTASQKIPKALFSQNSGETGNSLIPGVRFLQLPIIPDLRGTLSFAEYGQYLDFIPKRFFLVYDVLSQEVRGEHAHKKLQQFLVCVKGSLTVMVDDGNKREEYLLNTPGAALYIPPRVWGVQYQYSSDAVLLVLASDVYDPADYIRNYDEFLELVRK